MKPVNRPNALPALAANVQCNLPPLGERSYYRNLCYVYCLITGSIDWNKSCSTLTVFRPQT